MFDENSDLSARMKYIGRFLGFGETLKRVVRSRRRLKDSSILLTNREIDWFLRPLINLEILTEALSEALTIPDLEKEEVHDKRIDYLNDQTDKLREYIVELRDTLTKKGYFVEQTESTEQARFMQTQSSRGLANILTEAGYSPDKIMTYVRSPELFLSHILEKMSVPKEKMSLSNLDNASE